MVVVCVGKRNPSSEKCQIEIQCRCICAKRQAELVTKTDLPRGWDTPFGAVFTFYMLKMIG